MSTHKHSKRSLIGVSIALVVAIFTLLALGVRPAAAQQDPICDPVELAIALWTAYPGDVVQISDCQLALSDLLIVEEGVTLQGMGPSQTTLIVPAGEAGIFMRGGIVRDLTVSSAGQAAIVGHGIGSGDVVLSNVAVVSSLGIGIGFEGFESVTMDGVTVQGMVNPSNAATISPAATGDDVSTHGIVLTNAGTVNATNVDVTGFSNFGVIAVGSDLTWTGGGSNANILNNLTVYGGSATISNAVFSSNFRGDMIAGQFPVSVGFLAGATGSTTDVTVSLNEGIGVFSSGAGSVTHDGLSAGGNAMPAVWTQQSTYVELANATVGNNTVGGIFAIDTDSVSIANSTFFDTSLGLVGGSEVGDGIMLNNSTASLVNVTLANNARIGVLVNLGDAQDILDFNFANVAVSGGEASLGVIVQQGQLVGDKITDGVTRSPTTDAADDGFIAGGEPIDPVGGADPHPYMPLAETVTANGIFGDPPGPLKALVRGGHVHSVTHKETASGGQGWASPGGLLPESGFFFVDAAASGANDGSSWDDAFTDLQAALDAAEGNRYTVIWVAAGVYTPSARTDPADPRSATFQLSDRMEILGGFAGGEDPDPNGFDLSDRDFALNETILSGDLAGNDGSGGANNGENSYHVVSAVDVHIAFLDGFTISGGNANGAGDDSRGGGMINIGGWASVLNCTFRNNSASAGGAMLNADSRPWVRNCNFVDNRADPFDGGAIYSVGAGPYLRRCLFQDNVAIENGGAIMTNGGYPGVFHCRFIDNSAGGGGGAAYVQDGFGQFINCLFNGNSALFGGAMVVFCNEADPPVEAVVTNCTFGNNTASQPTSSDPRGSGGIINLNGIATVTNCIFWDNGDSRGMIEPAQIQTNAAATAVVNHSLIQGLTGELGGVGNIGSDPLFADGDLRLWCGSPAVDTGDDSAPGWPRWESAWYLDLDDNNRVSGGAVDMGAYEYAPCPDTVRFVSKNAAGAGDGTSWNDAYTDLQTALAAATPGMQIWVAAGTYTPTGPGGSRYATFQLISGVALYGGFAGTEYPGAFDLDNRDFLGNETTLSGDLAGNDGSGGANNGENSLHVVTGTATDATAVLDGFTITGGNADVSGTIHGSGGGMLNHTDGCPTVSNCTFRSNAAYHSGAAMRNGVGSHPTVRQCTFELNTKGAMANLFGASPQVSLCRFIGNTSGLGPAVRNYCAGSATFTSCIFEGNSGGGGGAMYNQDCAPIVSNCRFSGNSAAGASGGAMLNFNGGNPIVTNCTFVGNTSSTHPGGAISNEAAYGLSSNPTLSNCILWGNIDNTSVESSQMYNSDSTPIVNHCLVQYLSGVPGGTGNVGEGALFDDADGRLQFCSRAFDSGDNGFLPADTADLDGDGDTAEPIPFDLDGNPRVVNDTVDMGAYERQGAACTPDSDGDGVCDPCDEDDDGDGIADPIDTLPLTPSTLFDDGTTFGEVLDPGVGVELFPELDAILARFMGSDPDPWIFACNPNLVISPFGGAAEARLRCGSLIIEGVSGSVAVDFTIDGLAHRAVVSAEGILTLVPTVDEGTGELLAVAAIAEGPEDSVTVDGQTAPPGQSASVLGVAIDIKPGSYPNSINLGSNGSVPVAIFSSPDIDATAIDPLTVALAGATVNLRGNGTPQASTEDVDGDGLTDLVVHVSTEALELSEEDTAAFLGASLDTDGIGGVDTILRGIDTVRVVP